MQRTNVSFPTVTLTTGISTLFGLRTAANFSINQGAGKIEEARKYVHTGLTGVMIVGIMIGLLVFVLRSPILSLRRPERSATSIPAATAYLSITAFDCHSQMCLPIPVRP